MQALITPCLGPDALFPAPQHPRSKLRYVGYVTATPCQEHGTY
jgi:hypothetical protein